MHKTWPCEVSLCNRFNARFKDTIRSYEFFFCILRRVFPISVVLVYMNEKEMSEREQQDIRIIRYLDGDIDAGDAAALHRWMEADERNMRYFTEIKKIWDSSNALGNSPEELEMALNRFRQNFKPSPSIAARRRKEQCRF